MPVKEIVSAARADAKKKGAQKVEISLDCVAYAPHRLVDVQDWDVDFCVVSLYKVLSSYLTKGRRLLTYNAPLRYTAHIRQLSTFVLKHFKHPYHL